MEQTVIPQLRIANAERSLKFYVDGLGFTVDWKHQFEPGYPWFFSITRQGQTVFLSEHAGDCEPGGAVYFAVPDAEGCYEEFASRGIAAVGKPQNTPWGSREFRLKDPDGNQLRFASEAN